MSNFQDQPVGLEDRLRRLILSHAAEAPVDPASVQGQPIVPAAVPAANTVPLAAPAPVATGPSSPGLAPPGPVPPASPVLPKASSRKRPNQAQRRQMSAQLSIPVDPRPQYVGSQRGFPSPGSLASQRNVHHHPRTFQTPLATASSARSLSRDNPPPSAPPTNTGFPSPRPRHQASLSYHGPMSMAPPDQTPWGPPGLPHHQQPAQKLPYLTGGGMSHPPGIPQFNGQNGLHTRQASADIPSPRPRTPETFQEDIVAQAELLERLCMDVVANAQIDRQEIAEKEWFRANLEYVAQKAIAEHERTHNGVENFPAASVQLRSFGSLSSGFATKGSDLDIGIFSPLSRIQPDAPGSLIPRVLEKAFLDVGLGARLLTKTRVPILKVCEKPPEELRQLLLAERAKWEKGTSDNSDEEDIPEDANLPADDIQEDASLPTVQDGNTQEPVTVEERLKTFKQAESASLSAYFGAAKRLLRQVGGRDMTHSNITDFNDEDALLLNKVIVAFVDGLADTKLRDRLLSYPTFNRYDLTTKPDCRRTLLGAFTQIEGEQIAMLWESRPFQEKDRNREQVAENAVRFWARLQERPDFGRDPLGFQKQLQIASDQLKKIPTLQLLTHAQASNESASSYCARTQRLLHDLGGHDGRARLDLILPDLIHHFIEGISDPDIREKVRSFQQTHGITNLRVLSRKHKSLQLAKDFETCLEKGAYNEADAAKVRQYIELLRDPVSSGSTNGHPNGTIPLSPESAALLADIRRLGDPAAATPNRNKDRYQSALEFPKAGVGQQADVNFSAHLALQNTLLLRCYSHCDPRVRPVVLFVKHWAKVRRINTPYRGTLGSYGYVLMVLHYLMNVVQPFVLPNLQQIAHQRPPNPNLTPQQIEETVSVQGWDIQFWRDEEEILRLAQAGAINQNRQSVGELLSGFFEYYAKGGHPMSRVPCRSFDWGRDVLSIRTPGGLLTKQAKGWTGAKTVVDEVSSAAVAPAPMPSGHAAGPSDGGASDSNRPGSSPGNNNNNNNNASASANTLAGGHEGTKREVRYRYLFAIEDPFELDHNVARTVTHAGIVNIRDEFRRAWRIIRNTRREQPSASSQGPGQQQPSTRRHQQQGYGPWQQHQQQGGQSAAGAAGVNGIGPSGGGGPGGREGGRQEDLLEDVSLAEQEREREEFARLLEDLHGVGFATGELLAEPGGER
ncbi:hypothetical protein VTJ04DRAFT_4591 [Mycothermus thermophilus]|uniref:uncharacterized protein n=1 Tax=Humicola insolens TaxID=85995 RepID=UPI003742A60E